MMLLLGVNGGPYPLACPDMDIPRLGEGRVMAGYLYNKTRRWKNAHKFALGFCKYITKTRKMDDWVEVRLHLHLR